MVGRRCGVLVPFYWGAQVPDSCRQSSVEIDDTSALWKFRKVQLLAMQNFPKYRPIVRAAYGKYSNEVSEKRLAMEQQYLSIHESSPAKA